MMVCPPAAVAREMQVTIADDLSSVDVRVSAGMGKLEAQSPEVWSSLLVLENGVLENGTKRSRFLVPTDPAKELVYRVELSHTGAQWGISRWHNPLRLSDWTHWLLTPVNWSMTRPFELKLEVPGKGSAILPFQLIRHSPGQFAYKAYPILPDHGGLSVFGNAQVRQLVFGDTGMTSAVIGDQSDETRMLFEWIEQVVQAAVDVHGSAPGEKSLVVVVPVPFVRGVVPWAHVMRGGGSHIIAYVKQGASMDELLEDWTLFHEMTHLYHPYLHSGGRWVSEGFASYYQNVYRAHAGVVEPDYAYQRLMAGLERGRKENVRAGNRPVTQGGRMRTYWTGAALALGADVSIRRHSRQDGSLALAMGQFAARQMPVDRSWHPRDYLAALDDELATPVLVPMYDDYVRDRYFPEPELSIKDWHVIFGLD